MTKNKRTPITGNIASKLFKDIAALIEQSKKQTASIINSEITLLYWKVGRTIRSNILHHDRAEYGEQVVKRLAQQLTAQFGKGWSSQQLWNCLRAAEII